VSRSSSRRTLLGYARRIRGAYLLSFLFLCGMAALTAAKAWIIKPVVDTFLRDGAGTGGLLALCGAVVGIFVLQALLNWGYLLTASRAGARLVEHMRRDVFRHLLSQHLGWFTRHRGGDLTSRLVNDVAEFQWAALGSAQQLAAALLTLALLLGVLIAQDVRLALVSVGVMGAVGLLLRAFTGRLKRRGRETQEALADVADEMSETIGGMELILSFGLKRRWEERFAGVAARYRASQIRLAVINGASVAAVQLTIGLGVGAILLVLGRALLDGRITEGAFVSFLAAIYLMQAPAQTLAQAYGVLMRGIATGERALELMEDSDGLTFPAASAPPGDPSHVELEGVEFGYDGTPVLHGIDLDLRPGSLTLIVGDSGAGKTTLLRLLVRLHDPDAGRIRIGGTSLRDLTREDLYRHVAYVSQDVFLFDGSVEHNLRIAAPEATRAELEEAIRIADAADFLAELPDGLATVVGPRGARLSGGQRQRLAIARAILHRPGVLVLDEATAALDLAREAAVCRNLRDYARDRTIVAVTHRLSMARIADRVIVLRNGRIAEQGTAAELEAAGGEFARLVQSSRI
jgi:ABC-type multidrug transport system fused ATPase/permease subunit